MAAGNETPTPATSRRARRHRPDGRLDDHHRRALVVLQLRHLPRPLRAGLEHPSSWYTRTPPRTRQRHLHGVAARGRRRGALPAGQPGRRSGDRRQRDHHERDDRQGDRCRHRLAEPAALLAARSGAASATATAASATTAASGLRPRGGLQRLAERHRRHQYQPAAGSYTTTTTGTHRGCLRGPTGPDFDLYLQKRSGSGTWSNVAQSISATSTEDIVYSGTAGTYRWRVYSYSGSGAYTGGYTRPT